MWFVPWQNLLLCWSLSLLPVVPVLGVLLNVGVGSWWLCLRTADFNYMSGTRSNEGAWNEWRNCRQNRLEFGWWWCVPGFAAIRADVALVVVACKAKPNDGENGCV
jgi:hypothetical protein